ncbi:MAG: hypothetical protein RL021_2031 [Bacteroidota bacterium]|jgi:FtsH-binding integral membrane protein
MNSETPAALILILTISAAGMLLSRILKRKRKGGKAVAMDLAYLFFFTFMGGAFFEFILTSMAPGEILWAIGFICLFGGGFAIRAYPIFKGLNSME